MTDLLFAFYPWAKALHIISVISWMAALLYLPRLMVHHAEQAGLSGPRHEMLAMMELKLSKLIMRPAMIATWIFGLCLVLTPGIVDWGYWWPWIKAVSVIAMTLFHIWLVRQVNAFQSAENVLTGKHYRMMNEVPTFLMIVIVISVVVKY
ncbi:MAG: CopD family protein [Sulfitobacter sp.]